jgi:hypothetical protein
MFLLKLSGQKWKVPSNVPDACRVLIKSSDQGNHPTAFCLVELSYIVVHSGKDVQWQPGGTGIGGFGSFGRLVGLLVGCEALKSRWLRRDGSELYFRRFFCRDIVELEEFLGAEAERTGNEQIGEYLNGFIEVGDGAVVALPHAADLILGGGELG